jgi:membrane protein
LLLFFGFLIILSFFLEGGMTALNHEIAALFPSISEGSMLIFNAGFSLVFNTLLFFLIFEILPDARVNWRVGLLGGFVTAMLFDISQFVIGFYVSHSPYIKAWGAAGSLVVVLFWVFISSQVILYGAKLTFLFGEHFQRPIKPSAVLKFWQRKPKELA